MKKPDGKMAEVMERAHDIGIDAVVRVLHEYITTTDIYIAYLETYIDLEDETPMGRKEWDAMSLDCQAMVLKDRLDFTGGEVN